MLRKLLLATAALAALTVAARADTISMTAVVDGTLFGPLTSIDGTLNIQNQQLGAFDLNTVSVNAGPSFVAAPGILRTNTLNIDLNNAGTHSMVLDIIATITSGPGSLQALLSTFSVSGLTTGWTAQEQTFINGSLLADTGTFTNDSDSAKSIDAAFLGSPYTAEARYTITSNGIGQFNGGVDISIAAVPEPSTWAMMLLGFLGVGLFGMRGRVGSRPFRMIST